MSWLSGVAKAIGGGGPPQQNPLETIDKLCDRVRHSTLPEDRRASVQALKGLARDWKAARTIHTRDVGKSGLTALANALETDRHDTEMIQLLLETLKILLSPGKNAQQQSPDGERDLGAQFCDVFVQDPANVSRVLLLLEDYDFYVRYDTLQLLSILLKQNAHEVQMGVLTSPMAVSKLMDLLEEKRDAVRTEAILLLIALTQSNADIQKIIAFENAFERLFGLILDANIEPITVQDCLTLMLNLLRHNVSNQNFFRETSCVQRLRRVLYSFVSEQEDEYAQQQGMSNGPPAWNEQSVLNCALALSVVRTLVVPGSTNTAGNQNVINSADILPLVLELSLNHDIPFRVKSQALYALGEIIRGNTFNQAILNESIVYVPVSPSASSPLDVRGAGEVADFAPKSALLLIVSVAVTSITDTESVPCTQNLDLEVTQVRAAAAYVAECYLHNNVDGQMSMAMSVMNPPPDEIVGLELTEQPFANSVVIASVLDWHTSKEDTLRVWFAAGIMSHIIARNEKCKEIVMGMYNQQMQRHKKTHADEDDDDIPTLVQSVGHALLFAARDKAPLRIQLAYLSLLSVWLWEYPNAVTDYLSDGMNLQFLIEQIGQTTGVDTLVQGLAAFILGVCYLYQTDEAKPNVISRTQLHQIITTRVGVDQFSAKLARLRDDKRFANVASLEESTTTAQDAAGQVSLYVELETASFIKENLYSSQDQQALLSEDVVKQLRQTIVGKDQEIQSLNAKVQELEQLIGERSQTYEAEIASLQKANKEIQLHLTNANKRADALEADQNDLLVLLAEHDLDMQKMRTRLHELGDDQFAAQEDATGNEADQHQQSPPPATASPKQEPQAPPAGNASPAKSPFAPAVVAPPAPARTSSPSPAKSAASAPPQQVIPTELFGAPAQDGADFFASMSQQSSHDIVAPSASIVPLASLLPLPTSRPSSAASSPAGHAPATTTPTSATARAASPAPAPAPTYPVSMPAPFTLVPQHVDTVHPPVHQAKPAQATAPSPAQQQPKAPAVVEDTDGVFEI
ncbi:Vesicle-mediated ER to Golgi transport protein [Sorochytrium milnesiophthora]